MKLFEFARQDFDEDVSQYTGTDTSGNRGIKNAEENHHDWPKGFLKGGEIDVGQTGNHG